MYWEALGMPGSAASEMVEELAKYLQFAFYGLSRPGYTQDDFNQNASEIKYNLTVFWEAKAEVLNGDISQEERDQIYLLDIMAHKILASVDAGAVYSASPTYFEFFKAFINGGTPSRPESDAAAAEGVKAALDAAEASRRIGDESGAEALELVAGKIRDYKKTNDAEWSQKGFIDSIPGGMLTLVVGGLALAYVLGRTR